ncbi:sugar transferase [Pedococcus bigeumensis]|uniref:sugar transferase n=1 Tax=Pedococcus bigeumensis TaxID=433644 RepID=UPI0031D167D7
MRKRTTTSSRPAPPGDLTHSTKPTRPWHVGYRRRALLTDAATALVTSVAAIAIPVGGAPASVRWGVALLLPGVWILMLQLFHGYEQRFLGITTDEYRSVARAAISLGVVAVLSSWVMHFELARGLVLIVVPMLMLLGLVSRNLLRRSLLRRRSNGRDTQRTVVIGNIRTVGPMIRQLQAAPGEGMHVVGACVSGITNGGDFSSEVEGIPVFGYPEEALHAIDLLNAEVVAVSGDPDLSGRALRRLAWSLEERAVDLVVATGLLDVAGPRLSIRPAAGMPLLHVERPAMSGARRVVKRAVDWCLALGLTIAALPVLVAIGIAIRLDSSGPVLFRQTRVGARGETFSMLKFRSMGVDAEQRLAQLTESADAGNTVLFKMRHDPRITRVGGFLRRYSLDELPQLVNVLRGEMSLVGPRPPLPAEVAGYESDAVRRLRVRPGLTGLWQVSGRSDLSWDESLRLDLWYVDNWSLVLDLQIIVRTARAVLRGKGAY